MDTIAALCRARLGASSCCSAMIWPPIWPSGTVKGRPPSTPTGCIWRRITLHSPPGAPASGGRGWPGGHRPPADRQSLPSLRAFKRKHRVEAHPGPRAPQPVEKVFSTGPAGCPRNSEKFQRSFDPTRRDPDVLHHPDQREREPDGSLSPILPPNPLTEGSIDNLRRRPTWASAPVHYAG